MGEEQSEIEPPMTVKDVARYLQAHEQAVHNWVPTDRLKPMHAGNLLRFTKEAVDRWLAGADMIDSIRRPLCKK